jgi:hypothetical protein
LSTDENFQVTLPGSSEVRLKASGGAINRGFPHFELTHRINNAVRLEVWTDVEFRTLSATQRGAPASRGDYHELDIVVTPAGLPTGHRPTPGEVIIGVECKHTTYQKRLFREILGVRRELSYLQQTQPTPFRRWPRPSVPADPASCLMAYSTDPQITSFREPAAFFGVDLSFHAPP